MLRMWPLVLVSILLPPRAIAEPVPEGVHKDVRGPSELCGVIGDNVVAIREKVRSDPSIEQRDSGSERFETYYSSIDVKQWTFTTENEPAHPAGTCQRLYNAGGGTMQQRQMRCDASREACDALYREFQELDERIRQELRA